MPNSIKYNTVSESLALKKGDFWIGTGDVGKGTTASTGFYNGTAPASGGYTIYLNKSGGPAIYLAANDSQLITLTNIISAGSYSTAAQCLNYFSGQSDKMVFNIDYPPIITNGLSVNLDATSVLSYPNTGTTWYDLSSFNNNASLAIGSPTFTTFGGKRTILFNNTNKYVYNPPYDGFVLGSNPQISASNTSFTFEAWFYQLSGGGQTVILSNAGGCDGYRWGPQGTSAYWLLGNADCSQYAEGSVSNTTTMIGRWVQMVGIFDRAGTLGSGSRFYHYINATLEGSIGTYNPTIQLGAPGITACCGAFDGYLSVVRVYTRALSAAEILTNFNAQKGYFGL